MSFPGRIYILSVVISELSREGMCTSSEKYEFGITQALSETFDVTVLSTAAPWGHSEGNKSFALRGIGDRRNKRSIKHVFNVGIGEKDCVIFWGYDLARVVSLLRLRAKTGATVIPFIYDYHYEAIRRNRLPRRTLLDWYFKLAKGLIPLFDAALLFQEAAANDLRLRKPFHVTKPGVLRDELAIEGTRARSGRRSFDVVFCGTFNELNGIDVLIEAFRSWNDDDMRLLLYGYGPMLDIVRQASIDCPSIVYRGLAKDKDLKSVYREADLLVNLRRSSGKEEKYAFPSKLFEYIASEKPVLTSRLRCDADLLNNLNVIETVSVAELVESIRKVRAHYNEAVFHAGVAASIVRERYSYSTLAKELGSFLVTLMDKGRQHV